MNDTWHDTSFRKEIGIKIFNSIVAAIEETKNLDITTIEQLHETLQVYEEKLKKK